MGGGITEEPEIIHSSALAHSGHGRDHDQQARALWSNKAGGSHSDSRLFSSQYAGFPRLIEAVQEGTNAIGNLGVVTKSNTVAIIALLLAKQGIFPPAAYAFHIMTI
jgi:hypothetical protein